MVATTAIESEAAARAERNPDPSSPLTMSEAGAQSPVYAVLSPHAVKLQKVYRGYQTRRRLADSAVVVEELWWQAIDYARLNHSTISFFSKQNNAASRWNRALLNASKVGKGLSKDEKALKLAFQHWIEAIDPRHRYGHNLHFYYEEWCRSNAGQPFFYWLDIGDGRSVDLKECSRSVLREQIVKYLGPQEREQYEYAPCGGKIVHVQTGKPLDTTASEKAKWIFVMSPSKNLYVGQKKKGSFHHSSFLAGGTTIAAGRLVVENGVLKSLWAYSGHYRPSAENLEIFLSYLGSKGIDPKEIQISSYDDDNYKSPEEKPVETQRMKKPHQLQVPPSMAKNLFHLSVSIPDVRALSQTALTGPVTLSGGLVSPKTDVPRSAILSRIESKGRSKSYQLGDQLSCKWSCGVGPRIGCVADYPIELRVQALEFVNLTPRFPSSSTFLCFTPDLSTITPASGSASA